MADYSTLKVPDLKKKLADRGLVQSGNKADLIARLEEDDKKAGGAAAAGEDEIDWDEDDAKATTAPAAAAVAAGGQGRVANPVAVPNQKVDVDPAKTTDLKVSGGEGAPKAADGAVAASGATIAEVAKEPEAPKIDFTAGVPKTDAEKEAERRAKRAKRFGLSEDDEAKKKAERAKKFGLETDDATLKTLDSALPERRQKRGREDRGEKPTDRAAKRQTPDRRTAPASKTAAATKAKKPVGKILDDPEEKRKADERAKRFQQAAA